jgi:hypothetical protein
VVIFYKFTFVEFLVRQKIACRENSVEIYQENPIVILFCRYSDKTRISHFYEMEKNDFIFSGLYLSHYSNLTVEILQAERRFILLIIQLIV